MNSASHAFGTSVIVVLFIIMLIVAAFAARLFYSPDAMLM